MRTLRSMGILRGDVRCSLYRYSRQDWVPVKFEKIGFLKNPGQRVRVEVEYGGRARSLEDLIRGNWFAAFTYHVAADHLSRRKVSNEV